MRLPIVLAMIAGLSLACTREQPRASLDAGAGKGRAVTPAPPATPATTPPAKQAQPAPASTAAPSDVASLKARWEQLNDKCRGDSGDNPATMKACDERDAVYKAIESRGWCWGRDDQIEAEKTWVKCTPKGR